MAKAYFLFRKLDEIVACVLFALMSMATVVNVMARYILNRPIEWTEEFVRFSFIWVVFLGAAICTKLKRHVIIDALVVILPRRIRCVFYLLADLATVGLMAVLVYYGWSQAMMATQPLTTLKVPQGTVYIVAPISAALVVVYTLDDLRRHLRDLLAEYRRP